MSRSIQRIDWESFDYILKFAQKIHSNRNEPIPVLNPANKSAVLQCLEAPFSTFDGKFLYKGFKEKAAFLFYNFLKSHPLGNGNKRMACMTLGYFCIINDYLFAISENDFENLAIRVVNSDAARYENEIKYLFKLMNKFCVRLERRNQETN